MIVPRPFRCLRDHSLRLAGCTGVRDDSLRAVARLPQLTQLDLAGCKNVSNDGVAALTQLQQLASLNLGARSDRCAFVALASFPPSSGCCLV